MRRANTRGKGEHVTEGQGKVVVVEGVKLVPELQKHVERHWLVTFSYIRSMVLIGFRV